MKIHITLLHLFFSIYSFSQLQVDKPIVFISNQPNDNIVTEITTTSDDDLLNAEEVILNTKIYANTTYIDDTLNTIFNFELDSLYMGFSFFIKMPSDSIPNFNFIKINNLQPQLISLSFNQQNNANRFKKNEIIKVIYDGVKFQILKRKLKNCPQGFVKVNNNYCISKFRQGPGNFHDNVMYCDSLNARLCRWSEWYYACQKLTLGINSDMIQSGFEWVDTGAVVEEGAKIVGNTACTSHNVVNSINNYQMYFRCCYTR